MYCQPSLNIGELNGQLYRYCEELSDIKVSEGSEIAHRRVHRSCEPKSTTDKNEGEREGEGEGEREGEGRGEREREGREGEEEGEEEGGER